MNDPRIEAYCESMDNTFLSYMTRKCSSQELCKRLSSSLYNISQALGLGKTFNVTLIDGKNEFCGIKVYPDPAVLPLIYKQLDTLSATQFCKEWLVVITKYTVEIDVNCFNKQIINFTDKELTAIMLHELAHVDYSTTVPEMIYNSYRIHRADIRFGNKSAVRVAQQLFYTIPTLIACGMHIINGGIDGRKEEYIADKIFGINSYKPHLYSAIDKIIRAYGTSVFISENDAKKTVCNLIEQSNVNIKELSTRRRLIKDELLYQSANTHSKALRKAYVEVMTTLGIGFTDKYTNATIATESLLESIDKGEMQLNGILNQVRMVDTGSAIECAFNGKCECCCCDKYNAKLPTPLDVTNASLNIPKIHTNLDRLAILDELYALQEKAQSYADYAKQNNLYDLYKFKIDECMNAINHMITTVQGKEVTVTRFNKLLTYPEDYSL